MKKFIFIITVLFSSNALAWYDGFGYGGIGPYGGYSPVMPYYGGPYGYVMGFGVYGIPQPSFNYNTVIQQAPPIIINQQPPNVVYRDRYKKCDDECFRRYYSK